MSEMDLRQIDALMGEKIMGLTVRIAERASDGGLLVYTGDRDWLEQGTPYFVDENGQAWELPHYSTDIAAAWQVVERMRERGYLFEITDYVWAGQYRVLFFKRSANLKSKKAASAGNAPLAICLAALRALGVEVPS